MIDTIILIALLLMVILIPIHILTRVLTLRQSGMICDKCRYYTVWDKEEHCVFGLGWEPVPMTRTCGLFKEKRND